MRRLFLIVLVAAGCGIGSYNEFRDQLATRWCERQIRCGEVAGSESQQRCSLPGPLALTLRGAVDVPTSIAAHRMIFHPGNAEECLDAVKSAPCNVDQAADDLLRHCHGVVTGNVARDDVCWGDDECQGGVCVDPDCGGTCRAYAQPGGACVDKGGAPDMTCDPSVFFCGADGICHAKTAQGSPCDEERNCLFDFVCVANKCDDPLRIKRDDVCSVSGTPCEDGLYCNETGTCEPLKGPAEPCFKPDACQAGMACTSQTCTPWLDVGGACTPAGGGTIASGCPATDTCTASACTSIALFKAGPLAKCAIDADCDDGLFCASGNYCYYVGGINAVCQSDHECAKDLQCLMGACHTPGYVMCAPH